MKELFSFTGKESKVTLVWNEKYGLNANHRLDKSEVICAERNGL